MRKVDAVYSLLITQFSKICDDVANADDFSEALEAGPERDLFESVFLAFCDEKENLESFRDQLDVYPDFSQLYALVEKFHNNFDRFPGFDYKACMFGLMLAERILQNQTSPLSVGDVDQGFDFFYSDLDFECKAFSTNLPVLNRNILWVNPGSIESLTALANSNVSPDLLYYLASVGSEVDFALGKSMIVCDRACVTGRHSASANVIALLKLHMVSSGNRITRSNLYSAPPQNSSQQNYLPTNSYAQFSDVIHILGEYLDRTDVLAKYLSMYHVVENFMIKSQIVKLERKANGAMFSIRDFRRLNKAVEVSEADAVGKLVKSIFSLPYAAGDFGGFALSSWQRFLAAHTANSGEINGFLSGLVNGSSVNTSVAQFVGYFSALIYQMRCSIVHNKETEFHISNETYGAGCRLVMEEYLLPVLEEFVFLAMAEDNDVVWYRSNSITLWSLSA